MTPAPGAMAALLLLTAAGPSLASPTDQTPGGDRDWYWCQLAERPYGRTVYVSEVFTPSPGTSEAEVEAAFEDHVRRRYVRQAVAGGLCLGPKASRAEAREDRRGWMGRLDRDGVRIVSTRWRPGRSR
jgi:hypothetical protein